MITEEHHMSMCLRTVLQHHCIHGKMLLVSQPATRHDVAQTSDFMLGKIHEETLWPLYISLGEIANETAAVTQTD